MECDVCIIQYTAKLLVSFLQWRARLQYDAGRRKLPLSASADKLARLGSIISDARMLFRIWGLLPIFQWMIAMERNPAPTRKLRTIERLQGWSMLAYYPLEHLYYLLSHSIIPDKLTLPSITAFIPFIRSRPSHTQIPLKLGTLGLWSTRFWAAYVMLQLAHLREDSKLLRLRERTLSKTKTGATPAEKEELDKRKAALKNELIVNLAYLPQTLHWQKPPLFLFGIPDEFTASAEKSTEKGIFENEVWLNLCGLIAGIASWKSGWQATALKPTPSHADMSPVEPTGEKLAPHVEDPLKDVVEEPSLDEM
ncbi:hypothetical protein ACG7TL_007142 [Trametes sanguinea]